MTAHVTLTKRGNDRDDIDSPGTEVDAVSVPVDTFRRPVKQVWNLPGPLADDPVVEDNNSCYDGSENLSKLANANQTNGEKRVQMTETRNM